MREDHPIAGNNAPSQVLLSAQSLRGNLPTGFALAQVAETFQRSLAQETPVGTPNRPPRLPGSVRDVPKLLSTASPAVLLSSGSGVSLKAGTASTSSVRALSPQRFCQPGPCRSPSPLGRPHQKLAGSLRVPSPSKMLRRQVPTETPPTASSPSRSISFTAPPASPTVQQAATPSLSSQSIGVPARQKPAVTSANSNATPSSASSPCSPRLKLGTVRYCTPLPQPRATAGSPELPYGPPDGSPHVWFNRQQDSQHDITPYAEIYGVHPRLFNFNEQGEMVPPSPLSKSPKKSSQATELRYEGLALKTSPIKETNLLWFVDPVLDDPGLMVVAGRGGA